MENIASRVIDTRVQNPFLITYLESLSPTIHKSLAKAQAVQSELERLPPFTRQGNTIYRVQSTSCELLFKSRNELASSVEAFKNTIENASPESIGDGEFCLVKSMYLEILDFSRTLDNIHLQISRSGASESGQFKVGVPIPIPIPLPIPNHPSNPTPTPGPVEICKQECDAEYRDDVDICVQSFPQNPQKRLLCIEAANRRYAQCLRNCGKAAIL